METAMLNTPEIEELIEDLGEAALRRDSIDAFFNYACDSLSRFIRFDKASIATAHMNGGDVKDLECSCYKLDSRIANNYKKLGQHDFFNDVFSLHLLEDKYRLTRVLHASDYIRDWDEFSGTFFFNYHCKPFHTFDNIASAAKFPDHKNRYMILYLFKSDFQKFFTKYDIYVLEKIYPSLFYMWLCRMGQIDPETMTERLSMVGVIESLRNAPRLLELARLVAQEPAATSKEYAKELSPKSGNSEDTLSWKTVSNELGMLCEKLKVPRDAINRKRLLHKRVRFLEDI